MLLILVAGLALMIMPPGLCPCWLLRGVAVIHPHPAGNGHELHSHDYLFESFNAQPMASPPIVLFTTALLASLVQGAVQRLHSARRCLSGVSWISEVESPPPRRAV
jgi:hypothetical protein